MVRRLASGPVPGNEDHLILARRLGFPVLGRQNRKKGSCHSPRYAGIGWDLIAIARWRILRHQAIVTSCYTTSHFVIVPWQHQSITLLANRKCQAEQCLCGFCKVLKWCNWVSVVYGAIGIIEMFCSRSSRMKVECVRRACNKCKIVFYYFST